MELPRVLNIQPECVPASAIASMFLWYAGVADPDGCTLKWKLKNIVQRVKRCWQWNSQIRGRVRQRVVCPYPVGREQCHRDRLVVQDEIQVPVMLPVNAEPRAM